MAGQSKTGSNFVVAFSLPKSQNPEADGYILVNAPSVRDFNMSFGLNGMPSGHAKCLLNHTSDVPVSGVYGSMIMQGLGTEKKDDRVYGIYISNLVQGQNTTDSISIEFDFMIGSQAADLKQKNFACTGTSSAAMKECAKYAGMDYLSRYSDNGKNTDTMVWRLVNGNFEENMNYIVANSYVPSDVLFWVFDEMCGKIVISTFNTEKASKTRSLMLFSQDALVSTMDAAYKPSGLAGTTVYRYQSMARADYTSKWRASMFPNLVVDTTTNTGAKETGDCGGDCLDVIMTTAGANELPAGIRPPKSSTGVYGEPKLAMAFPMNGHKKYAVADTIRARLISEYSRMARVRIFNHLGPPVGSCVYLVAKNIMYNQGELNPDPDYTARYIVMSKTVNKISSTNTGTLGNKRSNMSTEYETILDLATNFQYSKNPAKEYDIVVGVMKQVANTIKEK